MNLVFLGEFESVKVYIAQDDDNHLILVGGNDAQRIAAMEYIKAIIEDIRTRTPKLQQWIEVKTCERYQ